VRPRTGPGERFARASGRVRRDRAEGVRNVGKLIAIVREEGYARLPDLTRQVPQVLAAQIEQLEAAVAALEKQLIAGHKSNPVSQRLASIPGIGPIIATAIAATVTEPSGFRSGREFAACDHRAILIWHRRPASAGLIFAIGVNVVTVE
jgi:transposase